MVIADTSAWIEFLRNPRSEAGRVVDALLARDEIAMVGTVMAEILQGARTESEFAMLRDSLAALRFFDTDKKAWLVAVLMSAQLRWQGLEVPLSDLVIAGVARQNATPIYALDHHFQTIPGLQLYSPDTK